MLIIPAPISPKQYEKRKELRDNKILHDFIKESNQELKFGVTPIFDLPDNRYIGMINDVIKHYKKHGWITSTNGGKTAIYLDYE